MDFTIALQVSEERLITLLEQINNQTTKQTKVTVSFHCLFYGCLLNYDMFLLLALTVVIYVHDSSDTEASKRSRGWWLASDMNCTPYMIYVCTSSLGCVLIAYMIWNLPRYLCILLATSSWSPHISHLRMQKLLRISRYYCYYNCCSQKFSNN